MKQFKYVSQNQETNFSFNTLYDYQVLIENNHGSLFVQKEAIMEFAAYYIKQKLEQSKKKIIKENKKKTKKRFSVKSATNKHKPTKYFNFKPFALIYMCLHHNEYFIIYDKKTDKLVLF